MRPLYLAVVFQADKIGVPPEHGPEYRIHCPELQCACHYSEAIFLLGVPARVFPNRYHLDYTFLSRPIVRSRQIRDY
jgi:hypothetical protein